MRDPSPEFAFRVARGANDIASGIASILRAFQSAPARPRPEPPRPRNPGPTWRAATERPKRSADKTISPGASWLAAVGRPRSAVEETIRAEWKAPLVNQRCCA